jgi:hypothetical protein
MKTIKVIVLTAVFGIVSMVAQAQTADEIIDKYLTQIGGKDKWQAVKSMKGIGVVKVQGMELPLTQLGKSPNKSKLSVSLQGMTIVFQAFDGTTGWSTNQMTMKPEKMEAEDSEILKQEVEMIDPFIDYASRGYKVALEGKETVEGTECHKIKLTKKPIKIDGKEEENSSYYFFDTQNNVPIVVRSTAKKGPTKGMITDMVMSDYQEVNGLFMPFSMTQKVNGQTGLNIIYTKFEINLEIADSEFAIPEGK